MCYGSDPDKFDRIECDDFNKIICKAEIKLVELFEIKKGWIYGFDENGVRWAINPDSIIKICHLDKFDSIEEFFKYFDSHHKLPMLFDRYTFRKDDDH